jgi:hypothetical protein
VNDPKRDTPMTIRLSHEEHEVLRLLSAWWCSQGKIDRPDKIAGLRRMLRMVKPPSESSPLALELRQAYQKMVDSD